MSEKIAAMIEEIKGLSVLELSELVHALEETFGVSAAAVAAPAAGGAAAAVVEEKTEFDVVMTSFGAEKIKVIKAAREQLGLGLKEAKDLVDGAPSTLVRGGSVRRRATTRERTILDCLESPGKAGGTEEVVRSLTAFAYVDVAALSAMARGKGPSAAARIGWLLTAKADDWHVDSAVLRQLKDAIATGPYRFGRPQGGEGGFSAEWRLILPDTNEEVTSWITNS